MSFDLYFIKFSKGKGGDLPREPMRRILQNQVFNQTDEDCYDIRFPDGSHVELDATGLSGSEPLSCCAFYIRGMTEAIVRLAFEITRETGCVMFPVMEDSPCVLVDASQRAELPAGFDGPIVECHSADELGQLLVGGYKEWSRYRDQVIQGP